MRMRYVKNENILGERIDFGFVLVTEVLEEEDGWDDEVGEKNGKKGIA